MRKKYYFSVYEFLGEKIHAFIPKLGNRCFCWFPSAMLVLMQVGTSIPIQNFKHVFGMSKVFLRCVVSDSSMF